MVQTKKTKRTEALQVMRRSWRLFGGPRVAGGGQGRAVWLLTVVVLPAMLGLPPACSLGVAGGRALEPSPAPLLRIEVGAHTSLVRRVVVDAARGLVVSVSDDATARVWDLASGRLLRTLRVPIGPGTEGSLYAAALSPDGRTLAVGGWTCGTWDRAGCVYLFDVQSGALVRRIAGLPDAIGDLAYSPDGRHLAIAFMKRPGTHSDGLRVLRTTDYATVRGDPDYADVSYNLDFSHDGRLVVSSFDGLVRLYDPAYRLVAKAPVAGGRKPVNARFSPDGRHIAVGFHDAPAVTVVSAADLGFAYQPSGPLEPRQRTLTTVAWSPDGESLYAAGELSAPGADNPVYRWPSQGRGTPVVLASVDRRMGDLRALPDGRLAFASEDPAVGLLDQNGAPLWARKAAMPDFQGARGQLLVSADGGVVEFPYAPGGIRRGRFSVAERRLQSGTLAPLPALRAPAQRAAGWGVEAWEDSPAPWVGGRRLALENNEVGRSLAVAPDEESFLLGTEWSVRRYGRDGRLLWQTPFPAVAYAVNASADGRIAVAALSDGTVRWLRMDDGREFLALFAHRDGADWIAWTPQGYYVSSPHGDRLVGWHLNRGRERAPDFYRAVQFERLLYRPDVVHSVFLHRGRIPGQARAARGDFEISRLDSIAPPRIRVLWLRPEGERDGTERALLRFEAEDAGLAMTEYAVFVNNLPVVPAAERRLAGREARVFAREVPLELWAPENEVRVEVSNGTSLGVTEHYVRTGGRSTVAERRGKLYLIALGVSHFLFLPEDLQLDYAARDAEELAAFFRRAGARHHDEVVTRVLSDGSGELPDKARVLKALALVEQARAGDTVVLFLASHGVSDAAGNYYFVPRDARREDLEQLAQGRPGSYPSLIEWSAFVDALRRAAGKRLLIVDTCQARRMEGTFDAHSLAKRSAASLFSLMVASQGAEQSQELPELGHGLFTAGLLEGLRGQADADGDGKVTLAEVFEFTQAFVQSRRAPELPQTPSLLAPPPLDRMPLPGGAPAG